MCGRYFIELASATEEELLLYEEMLAKGQLRPSGPGRLEHTPGMRNQIHIAVNGEFIAREMEWGFPGPNDRQGPINARCETMFDLPTFAEAALYRRCVVKVPGGYYEWKKKDPMRPRFSARIKGKDYIYMAGLYSQIDPVLGCARYVIVTQPANAELFPIHDRMPLMLTSGADIRGWLLDVDAARTIAANPPTVDLDINTNDPEQVALF